ncbi:nucleoside recognition domain-containing protein [Natronincola ferrireducens]|uniref:Nucleoside transporter/FeoB GTPase Gate domain-containing protein n=1 Tax=Natronincola ferrireducens TaxID=393762 RepID=A0A1G8ZUU8_9FIRM|nr:nucleoside recognition domain-containing protein [Natronincola ferrireducens]SDK18813.1 hypothetical protein SAMN05660472_00973 [Natronincola ferrireducens]
MIGVIKEASIGSFNSVYSIAIIVIPIMIVLELLGNYKILDKITQLFEFFTKIFNVSKESVLPWLVGLIFGLSYGAGVIIQTTKEGNVSKRDTFLITVFLATCHAIFEDTLIFVAVGANGFILLGIRFFVAFILTYLLSKQISLKDLAGVEQPTGERI